MKLTDKEIKERIEHLEPLKIESFQVAWTEYKTCEPKRTIPNSKILEELEKLSLRSRNRIPYEPSSVKNRKKVKTQVQLRSDRDDFYKTTIGGLDYRASETFFSPRFEEKVCGLLEGKNYNKMQPHEVEELDKSLQELSTVEFEWKEYNRRAITKETTHNLFKEEFEEFEKRLNSFCFPSDEDLKGQRAERKFLPYKVGVFAKSLVEHLYYDKEYKPLLFLLNNSAEELGQIIADSLEARRIFNNLSRISIKRAHERLFNHNKTHNYTDDVSLSIERVELIHDFQAAFAVEVFYAMISYGEKTKAIESDVADIVCRDVQVSIYYRSLLTNLNAKNVAAFGTFLDLINAMLNMFTSSGFFVDKLHSTSSNKSGRLTSTIQLVLPSKLIVEVLRPFKFPNIVRPQFLTKNDVDYLIKPLINGKGELTKSDYLVSALNFSRSKPHKVNELLLRLCEELFNSSLRMDPFTFQLSDWLKQGNIDLKTVHPDSIYEKETELRKLKKINNSTNISLKIVNAISVQLSKHSNVAVKFTSLLDPCGITKIERFGYFATKQLDATIVSEMIDLKYLRSRLFLAYHLRSFPIYITDTLCIRLRKYPREHWLSRTAGEFKHLLQNGRADRLTLKGFQNLLTAYYQANSEQLDQFNKFISESNISKKTGRATLTKYFQQNPLDFTLIKKPMYFLNLHLSLLQTIHTDYFTAENVEVDQNASALVILSLVLRSRSMAESSNVIGGSTKVSPYDYIRSKAREFFDTIGIEIILNKKDGEMTRETYMEENHDVIEFICKSRKLHKYAIMCFCYNQTALGRMEDFAAEWLDEFGYLPNIRQRKVLNSFASCYPQFVEFVYPNTQRKLDILKATIDIVCNEAPKISLRTLDGEVINWAFYATKSDKRKYFDIIDNKHKSYHADVLKERKKPLSAGSEEMRNSVQTLKNISDFPENLQLDSAGMKRRFLSYLIHSIDASILRRIINKMKREHKSSINHLHDCVILHPNDLDSFYTVIKEIYSTPDIYNLIEVGVFNQIESSLSPEGKEKLNVLKAEFFSLTDDFESELKNINPHHMYSLED